MKLYQNYIEGLSDNRLQQELAILERNEKKIGKALPKMQKKQKEQKVKEYKKIQEHIEKVKTLLEERKKNNESVQESTVEKLFPTVTKIIQENKTYIDDESEPEEKEEVVEPVIEEVKEEVEKEDKSVDIIMEAIVAENNKKKEPSPPKPITKPIRPEVILEEIKADGTIEKVIMNQGNRTYSHSNITLDLNIDDILNIDDQADSRTMILKTTKQDIIRKPVIVIDDAYLKDKTNEDIQRDLELTIVSRNIIKEKMMEKGIHEDLEKELSEKLDILNKNINKLKVKIA